jgi:hypothetical protein
MVVGISIIIEVGEVDACLNFLDKFNYSKWSIVLTSGLIEEGILDNSTFVQKITKYGEIIPALWMVQTNNNTWKENIVDDFISQWETKLGYKPYGFFMFQPDTYISDYLYSKEVLYVQGYCFDQYAIDWMTMRGGWQQPYYASSKHVLIPSMSKGIVVLPHVIWDYRDSFEIDHHYDSQPIDAYNMFNGSYEQAKNYVLNLMDEVLTKTEPVAYFLSQNEIFGWKGKFNSDSVFNNTDFFKSIIDRANLDNATVEMFNETAKWFNEQFSENPIYRVQDFVSPYSGKESEWYWDSKCRITRYDNYVVGYVEYEKQDEDPYLTSTGNPPSGSSNDPNNCINNSLRFTIDDFGNGTWRAPPQGNKVFYLQELSDFPSFYEAVHTPEYPSFLILALFMLTTLLAVTFYKKKVARARKTIRLSLRTSKTYFRKFRKVGEWRP